MYEPERAVSARHSFAGEGRNPSTPPAFYYRRHHHHCHHYTHSHHHHSRRHHHLFIQEVRRLERKVLKMGKALKKLGLMEDQVTNYDDDDDDKDAYDMVDYDAELQKKHFE